MTKHRDILSDEMARQRIEGSSYLRYIYTEIYSEFFQLMSCNKNLRVLEIGSECLECGISFTDLKQRLKDEGFDVDNECLNRCLREWFFNSFFQVFSFLLLFHYF
jgi:hypothetical protein